MKVINTLIAFLSFRGSVGSVNERRLITCLGGDPEPAVCGEVGTKSPCPMKYLFDVNETINFNHAEGGIYQMTFEQGSKNHEDCFNGICDTHKLEFEMEIIGKLSDPFGPHYAISRGGVDYICPSACGGDTFEGICQAFDENCTAVLDDRNQICEREQLDGTVYYDICIGGACAVQCTKDGPWNDDDCGGTEDDPCEARIDDYAINSIVKLHYSQNYFNHGDCEWSNCWSGTKTVYAKVIGDPTNSGQVEISRPAFEYLCPNACLISEWGVPTNFTQFCGNSAVDCRHGTAINTTEVCDMILRGSIFHEFIGVLTEDETTEGGGDETPGDGTTTAGGDETHGETSTTTSSGSGMAGLFLTGSCVIFLLT